MTSNMKDLTITTIQTLLHWEDKQANIEMFDRHIASIKTTTDLIVLPEMFTTGFTMNASMFAEDMEGDTVMWMKQKAKEKNAVICGSFIAEGNKNFYNRFLWMRPDGTYEYYDKRHLFRMADENNYYSEGDKKIIVELNGWKICPLVCYDLRFPVWSRNRLKSSTLKAPLPARQVESSEVLYEYDVLIYVANWPEKRNNAWKTLLQARAIENQSYVIGVNRVGADGKEINYSGDSAVYNSKGEQISTTKANEVRTETVQISYSELTEFRKAFPVFLDADDFTITG